MAKYKVLDSEFETFEEVVSWAENVHKIEFYLPPEIEAMMTEEDREAACAQLEGLITGKMDDEACCGSCEHCSCHDEDEQ